MASITLLFAAILFACMATAPVAQAQILGLIHINGTVFCNTGAATSTSTSPIFPNALIQLQCGGNVVSSTTTDSTGAFTMSLNLLTSLVSTLLNGCKLVVNTPLSTCNASLPTTGTLQSSLQLFNGPVGIVGGLLGQLLGDIVNLIPTRFVLNELGQ